MNVQGRGAEGFPDAQHNLGLFYKDDKDVRQDHTKAVEWFSKAAVQGHSDAQHRLALCYV